MTRPVATRSEWVLFALLLAGGAATVWAPLVTVRVLIGDDPPLPWSLWTQDVFGDWRANFYSTTEPWSRHPFTVTGTGPRLRERLNEMKANVETRARADGLVPFDELPEDVQRFWAEQDVNWLVADVLHHIAGRDE